MARVARVTVTQSEQAALEAAVQAAQDADTIRHLCGLLAKVRAAREDETPAGYPVKRFLEILGKSRKVAAPAAAPGGYYARLAKAIDGHGLTDARVEALAAWLDRQHWMQGAVSPDTVVRKLPDWLARAEKEAGRATTTTTGAPPELED